MILCNGSLAGIKDRLVKSSSRIWIKKRLLSSSKRNKMLLPSIILLLTACANTNFSPAGCPSLVEYPDDFQDQVYAQLNGDLFIPPSIRLMLDDYKNLREQVRACRGN